MIDNIILQNFKKNPIYIRLDTIFFKKNSCTITFGNKVYHRKEESLAFTIALLHVAHGLYQENKEIRGQQKKTLEPIFQVLERPNSNHKQQNL